MCADPFMHPERPIDAGVQLNHRGHITVLPWTEPTWPTTQPTTWPALTDPIDPPEHLCGDREADYIGPIEARIEGDKAADRAEMAMERGWAGAA